MRRLRIGVIVLLATVCAASPVAARIAAACPMDAAHACCCGDTGTKDAGCELRCADSAAVTETQAAVTRATTPNFHLDTAAPALTGAIDGDPSAHGRRRLAADPAPPSLKRYLRDCTLRL